MPLTPLPPLSFYAKPLLESKKPFSCATCGESRRDMAGLSAHMREKHMDSLQTTDNRSKFHGKKRLYLDARACLTCRCGYESANRAGFTAHLKTCREL